MSQLSKSIAVRVTPATYKSFQRVAKQYGKPSDLMREMIVALVDGRLSIKPDPKKESLYVD